MKNSPHYEIIMKIFIDENWHFFVIINIWWKEKGKKVISIIKRSKHNFDDTKAIEEGFFCSLLLKFFASFMPL